MSVESRSRLFMAYRSPVRTALKRRSAGRDSLARRGARHHRSATTTARLPTQKHQNGKAMLTPGAPNPAKGRADRATHIVARVVDRDGAVEILLRHQHRRDDEPR